MPLISFTIFRNAGVRFGLPLFVAVLMIFSLEPALPSYAPYRELLVVLPYVLLSLIERLAKQDNQ